MKDVTLMYYTSWHTSYAHTHINICVAKYNFFAVSKAPVQELVPDGRPSVCLSVCHSLFIMITTLHRNDIYMTDTYSQECGIEMSPNPIDQFLQQKGMKTRPPLKFSVGAITKKTKCARQSIFST